jgi:hypothetical protein
MPDTDTREVPDDPPPFLRTWNRIYGAVLIYLAATVAVLYWFTRAWQ